MRHGTCRIRLGVFSLILLSGALAVRPGPVREAVLAPCAAGPYAANASSAAAPEPVPPVHHHDELPPHAHVPSAACDPSGRRLELSLGGGAVKSYFVIDEILAGFRGDLGSRAVQALLARHLLSVVRPEPALGAVVLRHDGKGRIEPVLAALRDAPETAWAEPNWVATASEGCSHSPWFSGEGPLAAHNAKVLARCGFVQDPRSVATPRAAVSSGTGTGTSMGTSTADRAAGSQATGSADGARTIVTIIDTGMDFSHPVAEGRAAADAPTIVAVLDTGVDAAHPDLAGCVLPGRDFVNRDEDARDDSGHGTAMAGLIAGRVEGEWGIAGVAPGCRILPVKVCDRAGKASAGDVASGIVWAVERGARVISVSLGARRSSRMLDAAVAFAESRGAVVVAAAGNDNANQAHFPADCAGALAVGALDDEGRASAVTNLCARVDVYAPGEKLIVALPGGNFGLATGTSAAAALVSGAVARLLSAHPELASARVRHLVRAAVRPIAGLAGREGLTGGGRLDLDALLRDANRSEARTRIVDVRAIPARPCAGQTARLEVEIENAGPGTCLASAPRAVGGPALVFEGAPGALLLQEGERVLLRFHWVPDQPGTASWVFGEGDEERRVEVPVAPAGAESRDLRAVGFAIDGEAADAGLVRFAVDLRNLGSVAASGMSVHATVDGRDLACPSIAERVEVGEVHRLPLFWTVGDEAGGGLHELRVRVAYDGFDRSWTWRFALGHRHDGRDLEVQWQQAGGVDIIADAPVRVVPGRPYLPLLFFVPSRGTAAVGPSLRLDHVTVAVKDAPEPAAPGTLIYDDSSAAGSTLPPAVAGPGLVLVDEEGAPYVGTGGAPSLDLFHDEALTMNGRHAILRIPRALFGASTSPVTAVVKYLQVDAHWTYTAFAGDAIPIKDGIQKWTLRVAFTTAAMPTLPGEGHYYDTHLHTIAEWHQSPDPESEVFAPSKAYGGPIQMVRESAYAVGLVEDPSDTVNTVITSDHNNFHADTTPAFADADSPLHRPPFGPTSPASSVAADGTVKSEFKRMRELFGMAAGEEITISQETYYAGYAIPLGAHMLSYRAQQFPGTWHGGSGLATTLFGEPPLLALDKVLHDMAKLPHSDNHGAFAYAAHPFSGGFGFDEHHLDQAIGLTAPFRTSDTVSDKTGTFVFKGLQVLNGRAPGSIPGAAIDFADANPFVHPGWTGGAGWDHTLQVGLRSWHEILAQTLSWSFVDKVGKKFVRKTYISAGSDAHGDFNYSTGRAAMLIPMPYTFSLNSGHFADTVSYVFSEGKAGATPGERALNALADGNHVATDGPVIRFTMDSEGRFDSDKRVWHDQTSTAENANGTMGGGGTLDGAGTMLVRRGGPEVFFRYRYAGFPDYGSDGGAVKSIHVYRTSAGEPNPTWDRPYGSGFEKVIGKRGSLGASGAGADHAEKVAAAEEGLPAKVSCYALGAFTGGDPEIAPIGPEERRCYTNPVWAIPYDVAAKVKSVNAVDKRIDAGQLEIVFTFDLSMLPLAYPVAVQKLSAAGVSAGSAAPPITLCAPVGTWTANLATGADFARYVVTNVGPIPLSGEEYPAAGKYTFVAYFKDPVKDVNGNALHSIATTFTVDKPAAPAAKKCFVEATRGGSGAAAAWGLAMAALALLLAGRRRTPARRARVG